MTRDGEFADSLTVRLVPVPCLDGHRQCPRRMRDVTLTDLSLVVVTPALIAHANHVDQQ
jgi:hypothetical protein